MDLMFTLPRIVATILFPLLANALEPTRAASREDKRAITGRVEWPDGKPASGARIRWDAVDGDPILSFDLFGPSLVETDAHGKFEITDLKCPTYRVEARVKKEGDPNPWVAVADSVVVGAPAVVLKLVPGSKIEGRVLDDRGQPVKECSVLARRVQTQRDGRGSSTTPADPVELRDPKGRFVILGLTPGTWEVHAEAPNSAQSQPLMVTVPTQASIELRVLRLGSIAGHVVDPRGKAVAGATVRYPRRRPGTIFSTRDGEAVVETDASGAFVVEELEPAVLLLTASAPGFAPSQQLDFALKPGAHAQDIVLTLRAGGIISGEVVDAAGKGIGKRKVSASPTESYDYHDDRDAVTDAKGHFEIRDLAEGTYRVSSRKSDAVADIEKVDETVVTVVAGETVTVILGKPRDLPFRVSGVIRVGGQPLGDSALSATKIYGNPAFEQSETKTDAEGRYELGFDRPGTHWWDFTIGSLSFMSRRYVSEEAQQTIDFNVKGGRLSGRVMGLDGKAYAGAKVEIVTGRESLDLAPYHVSGDIATDAEGRFVFEPLAPAKYRIQIGRAGQSTFEGAQTHGVVIREDVNVTEAAMHEIAIALRPACTVSGVLRGPDGKPAADATVLGRDENGVLFDRERLARTDVEGRFSIHGLPAGKATFFACTLDLVSFPSAPVVLDARKSAKLELKLAKATRLWVDVLTADGQNVSQCQLRVFDADERDVDIHFWDESPEDGVEGTLVGVLSPGKYRVVAAHSSGVSTKTDVELRGEPVKAVELRFPR